MHEVKKDQSQTRTSETSSLLGGLDNDGDCKIGVVFSDGKSKGTKARRKWSLTDDDQEQDDDADNDQDSHLHVLPPHLLAHPVRAAAEALCGNCQVVYGRVSLSARTCSLPSVPHLPPSPCAMHACSAIGRSTAERGVMLHTCLALQVIEVLATLIDLVDVVSHDTDGLYCRSGVHIENGHTRRTRENVMRRLVEEDWGETYS